MAWYYLSSSSEVVSEVGLVKSGVDILPHAPINIMETNKHFVKRWKGIRKNNIYEQLDENTQFCKYYGTNLQ